MTQRPLVPEDLRRDRVAQLVNSAILVGRRARAGSGSQPLDYYMAPEWREDREFGAVLRAATSPISTATAPVLSTVSQQFLRALIPHSAGAALLASGQQVSFAGAGSISFPTLAAPSGLPSFIGEGAPIPSWGMQSSVGPVLHPCILAALCAATSEMLAAAEAESLIRAAMLDAASLALDSALFSNAAEVVGTSPPGLLFGLTPIVASTASGKGEAMADDVLALIGAVAAVSGNSPIALVANAAQAAALKLRTLGALDHPVFTTTALPAKSVLAIATQALVSASDAPRIDASQHADVHMSTTPAPIGSGGTVASPVYSIFQSDLVSLRLRWPLSWVLRDVRAAAVINGVTW